MNSEIESTAPGYVSGEDAADGITAVGGNPDAPLAEILGPEGWAVLCKDYAEVGTTPADLEATALTELDWLPHAALRATGAEVTPSLEAAAAREKVARVGRVVEWSGTYYAADTLDPRRSEWERVLSTAITRNNMLPIKPNSLPLLFFTGEQAMKAGATEAELRALRYLTPEAVRALTLRSRSLADADTREVRAQSLLIAAERAAESLAVPERIDLTTYTPSPVTWLVEGLWPVGGVLGLFAQRKAGKSTVVRELADSLLDGRSSFGRYSTHLDPAAEVVLIDTEMPPDLLHMEYMGMANLGRINLRSIRGVERTFDVRVPQVRARWAAQIAPGSVIVVDCLYALFGSLGISENDDTVKDVMSGLRSLALECGAAGLLIIHHLGKDSERGARGHSSLEDSPDVLCRIEMDGMPAADTPRLFSAFGRYGVSIEPARLILGSDHRLSLETVAEVKAEQRRTALSADADLVLKAIRDNPGCAASVIVDVTGLPDKRARTATKHLEEIGLVRDEGTAKTRQAWRAVPQPDPLDSFATVGETARRRVLEG
ncbi:AAA family ATPase [Nocardia sp. NPDC019219]|uniref:AAA family ATPase n=1 Tax=Nocardia sp. NPDC019219 TaxID=3154590 RepID=UPI0033EC47C3